VHKCTRQLGYLLVRNFAKILIDLNFFSLTDSAINLTKFKSINQSSSYFERINDDDDDDVFLEWSK